MNYYSVLLPWVNSKGTTYQRYGYCDNAHQFRASHVSVERMGDTFIEAPERRLSLVIL